MLKHRLAALWRGTLCYRPCQNNFFLLCKARTAFLNPQPSLAAAMPKIPATSKRARVMLSSEAQLPPGVAGGLDRSVGTVRAKFAAPEAALTGRTRGQRRRQAGALTAVSNGIKKEDLVIAEAAEMHTGNDRVSLQKSGRHKKPAERVTKGSTVAANGPRQVAEPVAKSAAKPVAKPVAKPAATSKRRRASVREDLPVTPDTAELESGATTDAVVKPKGRRTYKASAMTAAEISAAVDLRAAAVLDASKAAQQPKGKKGAKLQAGVLEGENSKNLGVNSDGSAGVGEPSSADALPETDLKPAKKRRVADPQKVEAARLLKLEQRALAKAEKERAFLEMQPEFLDNAVARLCRELGNDSLGMTAPWKLEDGLVGGARKWVGCHVSISGGMEKAVINAAACGCRAFAIDTQSKLRWVNPPLEESTVQAFRAACDAFGFSPAQILPHGSYLINLASPDPEMAKKGYEGFVRELVRCERLGLKLYNFHPGSTTGNCTHEESMAQIAQFINKAHAETKSVIVVLESMAGKGNTVGGKFEHLRYIIDRVDDKSRVGVCLDTCHMFSAGLDLRTPEACEATFADFEAIVGLQYLKALHVNDSKTDFNSGRDRHQNIGRGSIPLDTFRWIMTNPRFDGMPLIMETPVEEREPPVDHKRSLQHGRLVWRDPSGEHGVGTDRRDVMLLNSFAA